MKLKIVIEMDNAAFDPCQGEEAARILRELANSIDYHTLGPDCVIRLPFDINGNSVGKVQVTR